MCQLKSTYNALLYLLFCFFYSFNNAIYCHQLYFLNLAPKQYSFFYFFSPEKKCRKIFSHCVCGDKNIKLEIAWVVCDWNHIETDCCIMALGKLFFNIEGEEKKGVNKLTAVVTSVHSTFHFRHQLLNYFLP